MCPYMVGCGSKISMMCPLWLSSVDCNFAVRGHFQTIFKKLTDAKVGEGVRAMMLILV